MKETLKDKGLHSNTLAFLKNPAQMLINGKWVAAQSGETFNTINPADGNIIANIPLANEVDVNTAVQAARKSYNTV